MKIKKRLTAAVMAILLAATALPTAVLAEAKSDEKELTKVTLNEVAHSVFYAPQYVAIETVSYTHLTLPKNREV